MFTRQYERQFGKKLALSGVSRIMKLLGFTAQKPLYQAWQQDATLVRQWEFDTYPAIRAEARAAGATLYFADESGIRSDYHTATTWAPQGGTPVVQVTGKRFSLNMISAVSAQGEFRFMVHEGDFASLGVGRVVVLCRWLSVNVFEATYGEVSERIRSTRIQRPAGFS